MNYENNAPIFICDTCNDRDLTWKKFYDEYLQLFKTKENWDIEKNKVSCVIGFFCHMYKETYNTEYVFVPSSPNPYSSKECMDAWMLMATFKNNANDVRKYIFWVFKKVIKTSTAITSFGYFNTPNLIRKYNIMAERKNNYNRSSSLPENFIEWCNVNTPTIFTKYAFGTMNDLGALVSYVGKYKSEFDNNSDESKVLTMAETLRLTINGKLNVVQ